jgi:hypothetical protein
VPNRTDMGVVFLLFLNPVAQCPGLLNVTVPSVSEAYTNEQRIVHCV